MDFVFPLLNRGGFVNSEILIPLLCNMHHIAYVGAMPFMRGLGDDKSASKLVATHAGVPTAPWFCYRRGAPVNESDCPAAERWVIKPNASSASWAISDAFDWFGVANAVAGIHEQGHDAIVERDLVPNTEKATLKRFDDPELAPKMQAMAEKIAREFEPFDYGRIEFRLNRETGEINFIEINLNCNLWSEKVVAKSAAAAGFSHAQLLETILAEGLKRNGLIA